MTAACCPRFESLLPVIQQTMQAVADMTEAVARTGARAHGGNLVLACAASSMQRGAPCACVPAQRTGLAAHALLTFTRVSSSGCLRKTGRRQVRSAA